MEIDSGDPSSIGCVERDLRNHERNMREEQKGHDAETLIEFFTLEKEKSPNFYFDYELDDDNKLMRCFWADAESRRSYGCFGDVMVFDTTYNTNKYSIIFAPFVGVNNHGQTILFACGLMSNESTESFVWLFTQFLHAMSNQAPPLLITDQDAAIAKAISIVMPVTFHRFCIWHILNKFSEKINAMLYNEQYHRLVHIIKDSETPDEFERLWNEAMELTNLGCNEWLRSMYDIRSRWVPAYVNHIFSAGMSSNQRSESGHSFFKKYVNKKNSLMGFITRFNRALTHQNHEDVEEGADKSLLARHGLLAHKASILVDDASLTDARSTYLLGEFENFHLRVKEIDIVGNTGIPNYSSKSRESQQFIEDPSEVRAKGCGKRLKSSKEKTISKCNRQCSVCGVAGHDKRTCPTLNSRSNAFAYDMDNTSNEPGEHDTFTTIGSSNRQFGL
ncbi:Protein FAR1-RELATED SEQUENCE 5 [Abeliophyllum distichum]|uniref:Protein FAR1-RELATED SEQUENCE 5 n=1 Tax=Abeliophyllum distichum TaxID=126358 RepID=A0ABD1R2H2_9LAMI